MGGESSGWSQVVGKMAEIHQNRSEEMPSPAASDSAARRRWPHPAWFIIGAVVLTIGGLLAMVAFPYYRTEKLIVEIERQLGTAQISLDGLPGWATYLPSSLTAHVRKLEVVVLLSPNVDDDFAERVSHESNLEILILNAPRLTDRSLRSFQQRLPKLKHLVLVDAGEISSEAVAEFQRRRPEAHLVKSGPAYLGIMWHDTDMFLVATDPGSPADVAGLNVGDEINELDGVKLKDTFELVAAIAAHRPGEVVKVKFTRNSVEREIQVTLGKRAKLPTDIDSLCY